MLEKQPAKRCTINDIMKSEWIQRSIGKNKSLVSKNIETALANMTKFKVIQLFMQEVKPNKI